MIEGDNTPKISLEVYRDTYYSSTGKVSDIARQLAFTGFAIIWIFKESDAHTIQIHQELIYAGISLSLMLTADVLHYLYQSLLWLTVYEKYKRKNKSDNDKVPELSRNWNAPSWIFFTLKLLLLGVAYYFIISRLITLLEPIK